MKIEQSRVYAGSSRNLMCNRLAKTCKLKKYLFGLFIISVVYVGEAANYQWLKCNPIPDSITIKYPKVETTKTIEKPTLRELDSIAANNETVLIPSPGYQTLLPPALRRPEFLQVKSSATLTKITKPVIYIVCNNEGLLMNCPRDENNNSVDGSFGQSGKASVLNEFKDHNVINQFDVSEDDVNYIAGKVYWWSFKDSNISGNIDWELKKVVDYPNYWSANGVITVKGLLKNSYEKVSGYYSCELENGSKSPW